MSSMCVPPLWSTSSYFGVHLSVTTCDASGCLLEFRASPVILTLVISFCLSEEAEFVDSFYRYE